MPRKCRCGGRLHYVVELGHVWYWCERCTPVVVVRLTKALTGERRGIDG
jgi:hypothetical protein